MRTAKQAYRTTALKAESTNPVRYEHRHRSLVKESERTVVDDHGSLKITTWTCAVCHNEIEEILLVSHDGTVQRHPIRYPVASPATTGQLTAAVAPRIP
jgi:hypothetical protein